MVPRSTSSPRCRVAEAQASSALPETFDEVTVDWFNRALHRGGQLDATVARLAVDPLGPDAGLIGDLALVNVIYSAGQGPDKFIVKLPAADPASRAIGQMLRAYEREVAFYQHVAEHSPGVSVPRCFYAAADGSERAVLILEAVDADPVDALAGIALRQAEAAIEAMASLHATWWDSRRSFDWMPGFDGAGVGALAAAWQQNLPVFLERYAGVLPESTGEWAQRFVPQLVTWATRAASGPLTIAHTDFRLDNLLFRGPEVTVIDWQTAMRAPAAMDLSCFVSTSLTIDARRQFESPLIARYLDAMTQRGVEVDRSWLERSYDENLLWWMCQFGNNLAHLQPANPSTAEQLTEMVRRVYTAAADRNVDYLLEA